MTLSIPGLMELLARVVDHSIGMQAIKVLIAMMARADYENRIEASQGEIAAMAAMDRHAVSKTCRVLADLGFVERSKYRRGWYRLSPKLAWKGGATNLEKALKDARAI